MTKIIIGITGGIGSGKSTVCNVLENMGYPVFYSDVIGRDLLKYDEEVKSLIFQEFGEEVFEDGYIVRSKLGAIVFNDKNKLEILNSLIHPRVANSFKHWVSIQSKSIVFKESAILFETKDNSCHFVFSVITDLKERVERVRLRDGVTKEEVLVRINNQMTDNERKVLSDAVIYNNTDDLIIPQILNSISTIESSNK